MCQRSLFFVFGRSVDRKFVFCGQVSEALREGSEEEWDLVGHDPVGEDLFGPFLGVGDSVFLLLQNELGKIFISPHFAALRAAFLSI